MAWSVSIGEGHPRKRAALAVVTLAAGVFGFAFLGMWGLLISLAAVFVSTAEYWLPIRFRLDEAGAESKIGLSTNLLRWGDLKRLIHTADGVRLSPLPSPSRLDEFRGVYLRFAGNREEVLAKIAELSERYGNSVDREADAG
ncbi:MAG: hypothetical protein JNM28_06070 [Armatimonadetes bacterium]|nr:hypothetical protein [Armatimonadota bacterium]MBS1711569.1 hypothetical protein [Armatimonadota bacterium]MBX3109876.1 hypothetical protein [Fimbriimonadaceae bacterium]